MEQTAQNASRPVVPRWEPHEAHHFTMPYTRRKKPEWMEDRSPVKPVNRPRAKRQKADGDSGIKSTGGGAGGEKVRKNHR